MRTVEWPGLLIAACLVGAACGGSEPVAPKTAVAPQPSAPAEPLSAPAEPLEAGPPTTTNALPEPGASAARLGEASSPAASAGSRSSSTGPRSPTRSSDGHAREVGRGPADIRAIVIAHRDDARACYDRALKEHPGLEGDLVIRWTIDPKGNVTQVSRDDSRSQITEPAVSDCVAAVIEKLQFAASPGGYETKATYPFNFHPRPGVANSP
ncbi:MAG: AgmX/PglI C-terminal domain-containing protein [Polyangiaceae bacterium]